MAEAKEHPMSSGEITLLSAPPILASGSPRRRQWMEALQIPYEVWKPELDETPLPGEDPEAMVERLAKAKAEIVAQVNPGRWVIAADTTVAVDHHVLGKPVDVDDAVRMLGLIQGRNHEVHTGLCLRRDAEIHSLVDTAEVYLRPVSEAQARWYASTGEPMDKAGAYAVQGIAALFIDRIEGSFATVMGFPVERFGELTRSLGLLREWLQMP
jgi:septum formation protein